MRPNFSDEDAETEDASRLWGSGVRYDTLHCTSQILERASTEIHSWLTMVWTEFWLLHKPDLGGLIRRWTGRLNGVTTLHRQKMAMKSSQTFMIILAVLHTER